MHACARGAISRLWLVVVTARAHQLLDDHHRPAVPAVLLRLVGAHGGRQLVGAPHPVQVPE
jgi:plasmid replication initiation protein